MIQKGVIGILKGYKKYISPYLGNHCRFSPTCSVYAMESIKKFGVLRGIFLGTIRLLKCQPFHKGGEDQVPEKFEVKKIWTQKN